MSCYTTKHFHECFNLKIFPHCAIGMLHDGLYLAANAAEVFILKHPSRPIR